MKTTQSFDEITLSSYMDGELDSATMHDVEMFLERDNDAQRYVLRAVKTSAHLRGAMNEDLHEEIPGRLLDVLSRPASPKRHHSWSNHPLFRMAAAVFLVFLGLGTGMLFDRNGNEHLPAMLLPLPDRYSQIVNEALENNISGTASQWHQPQAPFRVTVTPVRTYKDQNGEFYREYRLEVTTNTQLNQINGLAYRDATGNWKTKALYF